MNDNHIFKTVLIAIIAITLLLGGVIASSILTTGWTKDLVKIAIEKGQNPVYVKCAMESNSSNECKTMMTVIAISRSDK